MLIERIDTLIFDLDNTLIDRNAAMRMSLHAWLSNTGFTWNTIRNGPEQLYAIRQLGLYQPAGICNLVIE